MIVDVRNVLYTLYIGYILSVLIFKTWKISSKLILKTWQLSSFKHRELHPRGFTLMQLMNSPFHQTIHPSRLLTPYPIYNFDEFYSFYSWIHLPVNICCMIFRVDIIIFLPCIVNSILAILLIAMAGVISAGFASFCSDMVASPEISLITE